MVNNSFNNQKAIIRQLNILVKKFRHKMLLHTLVKLAPWLIVFVIVGSVYTLPFTYFVISIFLVVLLPLYLSIRSERYQKVTLQSLLLHLNRIYPELQESAHLVNSNAASFSILQAIQKERMITQLSKLLENDINNLLPKIPHRHNITSAILALLVLLVVYADFVWLPILTGQQEVPNKVIDVKNQSKVNINEIDIAESKVLITPPAYTELNKRNQSELNASAISGSLFNWNIVFNLPVDNAFLVFSSGKKVVLDSKKPLSFSVEKQIDYTGVYRIGVVRNEVEYTLPEFYTLTINKDAKAKIKIVTPKKTITEIATNANTAISTHVRITDDFKVDRVEILASIAKGSGESVKFRDQTFLFDRVEVNNGVEHHYKTWQLQDLKMEPGDELYFTVKAWDNRLPQAQMTRSSTKIIRWLEDEQQGVMSDGVLIDFMPEYFKSQRQIILDTIDLINDKGELSTDKFVETSELLGVSQSELKEKYGQYLGDEVEDGGGSHAISHEASEQISNIEEAESTSDNDHHHDEAGGHATDGFEMTGFGTDKSGRAELINQFGHNHEDADIGIMARQDPKALMKRSIANMWQAELHLMLSEPSKALPFEQEALKFLKMAKKAERIYVKRLGFEPPPVSEQRRYQGELDDILTYQRNVNIDLSDSDKAQLSEVFTWLNNVVNKPLLQDTPVLSNYQRQLIVKVKMQFEVLVENRPALIKYVAILERILQANSLILNECRTCLPELLAKIWQLIPDPIAKPHSSRSPYIDSDVLFNKYAEFLSVRP
jgi:hypothetical protein